MRINTNVASLNAQRILSKTGSDVAKSIGRLSSGFRINRAADDAAGLGIANGLRNDIRSLKQASRNAEQANALLQVAEGATSTIGNIVDRMKELAAQAASSNSGDRAALQSEFATLSEEITRIVNTTEYQGNSLIDGTMGTVVGAGSTFAPHASGVSGVALDGARVGAYTVSMATDGSTMTITEGTRSQTLDVAADSTIDFDQFGVSVSFGTIADGTALATQVNANGSLAVEAGASGAAQFLVSSSGSYGDQDLVGLSSSIDLSLSALGIASSDIGTQGGAQTALTALDGAVDVISSALSTIGSTQNRIDFALENVKTTIENFAAAESTIRDADMAEEMSTLTKQQILQQAGTAMLAQANSAPQQILRLLQ